MSDQISTWKKVRRHAEYAGVRLVMWVGKWIPMASARSFGAALGWVAWEVVRFRRDVSLENITRSLGVSQVEARRIGRASYMNFGRSFTETASLSGLTPDDVRRISRIEGREVLDAVCDGGRGGVLFSGHLGNWEVMVASMCAYGYPVYALLGRQSNERVNELLVRLRRRHMGVVPREEGLKGVLRVVQEGGIVALVADQDAGSRGVFIEFLGRTASAHHGPASTALRAECPIIYGFLRRLPGGRFESIFEGPVYPEPGANAEDTVVEITQRLNRRLEEEVRRHPEEYLWAHRRWKTQPPQTPAD